MPKLDGLDFLGSVKEVSPHTEVIMATGFGTIETAVSAMKKGAYDFIQKPFDLQEIFALVEKALEKSDLRAIIGVYEASRAIFSSLNLETLLPIINKVAMHILRADDGAIVFLDDNNNFHLGAALGLTESEKDKRVLLARKIFEDPLCWEEPLIIGPDDRSEMNQKTFQLLGAKNSLVCPLAASGKLLGALVLCRSKNEKFIPADLCNLTIFASQMVLAINNARVHNALEEKINELEAAYTEMEEMQNKLIESEKLAAVGQLAAGVAHELNNPLTGIMGFAQLLLKDKDLSDQQKEDLSLILEQSRRCKTIIQNLLQFSRRKKPTKKPIDLAPLLQETLDLVKYDFSTSGIEIIQKIPVSRPFVYGDPNQLQQVFLNLMTNAKHAMRGQTQAQLIIEMSAKDKKVVMSFQDSGTGIHPDVIGKIFDPFFTTKPTGKGTGLGLSISYGIIKEHDGEIQVQSQKGKGANFIIEFPAHELV
jgi:signal transduction histidine kinase